MNDPFLECVHGVIFCILLIFVLDARQDSLECCIIVFVFLQTSRYAALIFGIMYGSMHFKSLQKKENLFREEEARLAPIRQKQIEEEKQRLNRGAFNVFRLFNQGSFKSEKINW